MAGLEIKISVTDVEPMISYVEEIHSIVDFLRDKPQLNTLEERIIEKHDWFIEQLENERDEQSKPYLEVMKTGGAE